MIRTLTTITMTAAILLCCLTPPAHANGPMTYTIEPYDLDGAGLTMNITQLQFGGHYCPCTKIPYPADGTPTHNQQGADNIWKATQQGIIKPGDTLLGFSLGAQVISLFLAQHQLPPGVHVLLAGDTEARNTNLNAQHQGIPTDITNDVTAVVNEFDGWSDAPTNPASPNYLLAWWTAGFGTQILHYYLNTDPTNPANTVYQRGNIRYILIPTQHLPQNAYLRAAGMAPNQAAEDAQHDQINTAYNRPGSTPAQRAAAASQQVPFPQPIWTNKPEPAAAIR